MPSPSPATTPHPMGPRHRSPWLLAGLAALTGILGLLAVLAPVTADDPVVSWPRAGEQPASTVLPLSPYRPLQLQATVPCTVLQALDARGGGAALRTMPADAWAAVDQGLLVTVAAGQVRVRASGMGLVTEPVPARDCTYQIRADSGGVRVERDGTELAVESGLLPPQVAQLETALEGLPAASGLAVELHTDARYESSPTVLKTVLLVAHALALTV
ncbi:MAG: arabinosyltransferase, partial [Actinomycetota bacterium]|nr:arabinosyltransferase [Actinomycetota bacterium]